MLSGLSADLRKYTDVIGRYDNTISNYFCDRQTTQASEKPVQLKFVSLST